MKNQLIKIFSFFFLLLIIVSCKKDDGVTPPVIEPGNAGLLIIDHNNIDLNSIPLNWVDSAKKKLHIAYQHTSHGSQLTTGMAGLEDWKGDQYAWGNGTAAGQLDLHDYAMSGDLGNPDRTTWASRTRDYLGSNPDVNVIIWAWCGQVSSASEEDINTYLDLMQGLENDFPNVSFVYMTGHLDGSGVDGNLHQRNEQIRKFCKDNEKILFDFADIESYDPDGNYYLDKAADDECDYDSNGDGSRDANWATAWQDTHDQGTDWYSCSSAHSQPINANMKAYAAWWLWARLGGWNGQ